MLVTGASGFLGSRLVPSLVQAGWSVTALVHRTPPAALQSVSSVRFCPGSLEDLDSLRIAARGCRAVVHLAAATDTSDAEINRRANVEGTARLLEACRREGVARLLHFSSHCAGRTLRDAYGETKLQAETLVRAFAGEATILRPTMVCGRGSKEFETFARLVRRLPVIPVPGPGTFRLQPSLVEDVVPAAVRALDVPEAVGKTYELAGGESLTFRELVDLVARLQGRRRHVLSLPPGPVLALVRALGAITRQPMVSVDQAMAFLQDTVVDIEPARLDLAFNPGHLADGLTWLSAR